MNSQLRTELVEKENKKSSLKLGINGLGRIGKLTLWHHVARKYFAELIVNIGREAGRSLQDVADYIVHDSTYGHLANYLFGYKGGRVIENLNEEHGTMLINGMPVTILRRDRNPKDLPWKQMQVPIIVEATGKFLDPTAPPDFKNGSIKGHLVAGAQKVLVSAPFKIKDKSLPMPEEAITMVMGINDHQYQALKHNIISAASCTTTCLAFMVKPLLDYFGADRILSASMVTVHAATGSQEVLDRLPDPKADDLRKNRSIMNNIILTSTGAAKALALVIPEMKKIGFIAESVRIPTNTGSLIVLVVNIQDENLENPLNREKINQVYQRAAATYMQKYLCFSERQNVSADIIGTPFAAAIIEGAETHTRTAHICVDLAKIPGLPQEISAPKGSCLVEIPVTQAVVYGWYDNELGSYTNMLGDLTVKVAEELLL
jgi:glyceraldehyde 3-phosphate dehydrogenase